MTAAVLLNQYALNASPRYTHGEAPDVALTLSATGRAVRVVKVSGRAVMAVSSAAHYRVLARMTGTAVARFEALPADGWRIIGVSAESTTFRVDASGIAVRVVPMTGRATFSVQSRGDAIRYARPRTETLPAQGETLNGAMLNGAPSQDARPVMQASLALDARVLATRLIRPELPVLEAGAGLSPLAYRLTRWMTPRPIRAVCHLFARESHIRRARINRVYATGISVMRVTSRAVPNTILGYGFSYFHATSRIDPAAVYVSRDARPTRAVLRVTSSATASLKLHLRAIAVMSVSSSAVCDIIRDGMRYAYAEGKPALMRVSSHTQAVRLARVRGVPQPCHVEMIERRVLIARDMRGRTEMRLSASGRIGTITRWVAARMHFAVSAAAMPFEPVVLRKMSGTAVLEAHSRAEPWHWVARSAEGRAEIGMSVAPTESRVYVDARGMARFSAQMSASPVRYAYASGVAVNVGTISMKATIAVARWMTAEPATMRAESVGAPRQHHAATAVPAVARLEARPAEAGMATVRATPQPARMRVEIGPLVPRNIVIRATPQPARMRVEIGPLVPRNIVIRAEGRAVFEAFSSAMPRRLHHVDTWAPQQADSGPIGSMMLNGGGPYWRGASVATARAVTVPTTFKINAGRAANDRRVIRLPGDNRQLNVPYTSREYRVA